jgi:hypothetical protein
VSPSTALLRAVQTAFGTCCDNQGAVAGARLRRVRTLRWRENGMIRAFVEFVLGNFRLTFFVTGLLFSGVAIARAPKPRPEQSGNGEA